MTHVPRGSLAPDEIVGTRRSLLVPFIVGWALFMQTLDATIVSNALPSIAASFHADAIGLNVVVTAYLLALTMFLPVTGWFADRFGARPIFALAIALFTLSSLSCGLSSNLTELVLARIVQGASASMMTPVGRLILLRSLPRGEMVRSMSFLIFPGVLGTMLGPPLGGYLVSFASWRWIFFINLPMGLCGVVLALIYVPRLNAQALRRLDLKGFLLSAGGLATLVYAFENVGRADASIAMLLTLGGLGALLLTLFVRHCLQGSDRLLDLGVFRDSIYRSATIGGFFARLAIGASPFTLALFLQLGLNFTPFEAGLIGTAEALGSLLFVGSANMVVSRFGYRHALIASVTTTSLALASYSLFGTATPIWVMALTLFLGGAARSILFTLLNAVAFLRLPESVMSHASSLSAMIQQLALSIGVGIAALVINLTRTHDYLTAAQFRPTFLIVAFLSACGLIFLWPLPQRRDEQPGARPARP